MSGEYELAKSFYNHENWDTFPPLAKVDVLQHLLRHNDGLKLNKKNSDARKVLVNELVALEAL